MRKATTSLAADWNRRRDSSKNARSEADGSFPAFDHINSVVAETILQKEFRIICKCAEAG
jgi:hypothetical protein